MKITHRLIESENNTLLGTVYALDNGAGYVWQIANPRANAIEPLRATADEALQDMGAVFSGVPAHVITE